MLDISRFDADADTVAHRDLERFEAQVTSFVQDIENHRSAISSR